MMDYRQNLREAVLGMDLDMRRKCDALNLLEQIFDENFSVETLVEQIGSGTVPATYIVKPQTGGRDD
jgi:hypothetical protein